MSRKILRRLLIPALAGALLLFALLQAADRRALRDGVMQADPESILASPSLAPAALARGADLFAAHCARCHGADGRGSQAQAVPDLTDADHLYGSGQVAEIEQIVLHGIRSGDPKGWNLASMPAYGREKPYAREAIAPLRPQETGDLVAYLRSFQGDWTDRAAIDRGKALYAAKGCWDCHGIDASGDGAVGAPDLVDGVWLYGDAPAAIRRSIADGRAGSSPAFAKSLTAFDARAVSLYVAHLHDALPRKTR